MKLRTLNVSYGQVAVYLSSLQQPFNNWRDAHVKQGFAWRPGSVSFATLEPAGPLELDVVAGTPNAQVTTAIRIISVPFEVDEAGNVEVSSIEDRYGISLPPGDYRLTFEHGIGNDGGMWCRFSFEPTSNAVVAEVVRTDAALAPGELLIVEADPAG